MNLKGRAVVLALAATAAATFSVSAAVVAPFEVGTWANFCKGAVSHTFDDNCPRQLSVAAPAFENVGMRMTFFIVTGQGTADAADWNGLRQAAAKGHEIGSHAVNHPNGAAMSASDFGPSQSTIQQKVSAPCVTLAYPNCTVVNGSKQYYIAARSCFKGAEGANAATPADWEAIDSKMFGSCSGGLNDANSMNSFAKGAESDKWMVTCHHGLDGDNHAFANTSVNALKSHLDYLNQNRSTIWCETFGNVARYIKERDAANIEVESSTDDSIVISLTDDLPDSIFNYPLTIRRPVPEGWETVIVKQGDFDTEDTVVTQDGTEYVMFKAIPDSDNVVITKVTTGSRTVGRRGELSGVAPVTFSRSSTLTIDRRYFKGSALSVAFFDLTGKVLARYTLSADVTSIAVPDQQISRSACIVKISGNGVAYTGKFMPQL